MKTLFDTAENWFLQRLVYQDALEIYIVEGIRSVEPQKIHIAGVDLGEGRSTNITEKSRQFLVAFQHVLAYQITNESYRTADEYETRSKGVLCKYDRSRYLDFIRSSTLIDSLRANAYSHFGLILEDDIIDVIAEAEPRVEQV